jgi:hypothetical protein
VSYQFHTAVAGSFGFLQHAAVNESDLRCSLAIFLWQRDYPRTHINAASNHEFISWMFTDSVRMASIAHYVTSAKIPLSLLCILSF